VLTQAEKHADIFHIQSHPNIMFLKFTQISSVVWKTVL